MKVNRQHNLPTTQLYYKDFHSNHHENLNDFFHMHTDAPYFKQPLVIKDICPQLSSKIDYKKRNSKLNGDTSLSSFFNSYDERNSFLVPSFNPSSGLEDFLGERFIPEGTMTNIQDPQLYEYKLQNKTIKDQVKDKITGASDAREVFRSGIMAGLAPPTGLGGELGEDVGVHIPYIPPPPVQFNVDYRHVDGWGRVTILPNETNEQAAVRLQNNHLIRNQSNLTLADALQQATTPPDTPPDSPKSLKSSSPKSKKTIIPIAPTTPAELKKKSLTRQFSDTEGDSGSSGDEGDTETEEKNKTKQTRAKTITVDFTPLPDAKLKALYDSITPYKDKINGKNKAITIGDIPKDAHVGNMYDYMTQMGLRYNRPKTINAILKDIEQEQQKRHSTPAKASHKTPEKVIENIILRHANKKRIGNKSNK